MFMFQPLINFKEMCNFIGVVRRYLVYIMVKVPCGIFIRNGNDFIVGFILINHANYTDWIALYFHQRI